MSTTSESPALPAARGPVTLWAACDAYLRRYKVSPYKTRKEKESQVRALLRFLEAIGVRRDQLVPGTMPQHVGRYFDHLRGELAGSRPYSPRTQLKAFYVVRGVMQAAGALGWLDEVPRPRDRTLFRRDPYTYEQLRRILGAARQVAEEYRKDPRMWHYQQIYPLLMVLYLTGLRLDEALQLRTDDVNLELGRIIVREPKMIELKGEEEVVHLGGLAVKVLRAWLTIRNRRGLAVHNVFVNAQGKPIARGRSLHPNTVYRMRDLVAARARMRPAEVIPHRMRHSVASHLLWASIDVKTVKDFLRHRDIMSTEVYAKLNDTTMKAAAEKICAVLLEFERPEPTGSNGG